VLVGLVYPLFEGVAWNQKFGIQGWLEAATGAEFHDFAGSIVVDAVGGWVALAAVLLLGARSNRYRKDGAISAHPPSSIPFLALGAWMLTVGWFGFNVMSAQTLDKISGLVAVNSLMAMAGGAIVATLIGSNDPGFVHNGPLAGLVAGSVAGAIFVFLFTLPQNRWRIALASGFAVYGALRALMGLRMSQDDEFAGADLSTRKIGATPDREASW